EAIMQYLFLAGRVLFGGFFLLAGIDHFRHVAMMAPYAASKRIPVPRLSVLGSGALIMLGGLSVLLGVRPTWGVVLLTAFLVPTSFLMHNYWTATDPSARMMDQTNFKKNIALLGAAWMLLLVPQPWPFSLSW
ncbi:MAG TPA: DoxX family protein, partial [Gemmatimonadales bacterium]|nr:DoxX family protein [Gemmatimonadales bacterium]